MEEERDAQIADVLREFRLAIAAVGKEFRSSFAQWQEDAQFRLDREVGRQLAKHPEVYAELKRGARQLRKCVDKVTRDLGLR